MGNVFTPLPQKYSLVLFLEESLDTSLVKNTKYFKFADLLCCFNRSFLCLLQNTHDQCGLQSFLGQMVRSEGDLVQGEMGRASFFRRRREGTTCSHLRQGREKSAGNVHLWRQQQGQGEPGGRRLVVGKVGKVRKVVCGVHHRAGDGKGG